MKPSIEKKLAALETRHREINHMLSDPVVVADQNKFRDLSKEYTQLEPIVNCFHKYTINQKALAEAEEMLNTQDRELRNLATEEINNLKTIQQELEEEIKILLLPEDPNDQRNVFLEIRAGTGGDEAALFAGNLFRMYSRFAENVNWHVEILSSNEGEHGGYKEIISRISGKNVYSQLKFESGVHEINPTELRIDTFRSQGAGGQHVNTTDSAVRITHIPTNTVAECQDERSQHKNRAKAMSLLQAKLLIQEQAKQRQERAATRRSLVGSGDRSERIRTYNFPQGRVTDHRINLTLYKLDEILEGDLEQIISSLIREHQADQLADMGE